MIKSRYLAPIMVALYLICTTPALASDTIECALESVESHDEMMRYGKMQAASYFGKVDRSDPNGDGSLDGNVDYCGYENSYSDDKIDALRRYSWAQAGIDYVKDELSRHGNVPGSFGNIFYNKLSAAEKSEIVKSHILTKARAAKLTSDLGAAYKGPNDKAALQMATAWIYMLTDLELAARQFSVL